MTYSILAYDHITGEYGGAAATGSLCVGGWVLRGDAESGLSASQGTAPSTIWGETVLRLMRDGMPAQDAVKRVTEPDPGNPYRQLAAIDPKGQTAAFTGGSSVQVAHAIAQPDQVAAGNMLSSDQVLPAVIDGYRSASGPMAERLLAALDAGAAAGGDSRGLLSAALLVVGRRRAPLTLRIDHDATPLPALRHLYTLSQTDPYRSWTELVPTLDEPYSAPDAAALAEKPPSDS